MFIGYEPRSLDVNATGLYGYVQAKLTERMLEWAKGSRTDKQDSYLPEFPMRLLYIVLTAAFTLVSAWGVGAGIVAAVVCT